MILLIAPIVELIKEMAINSYSFNSSYLFLTNVKIMYSFLFLYLPKKLCVKWKSILH